MPADQDRSTNVDPPPDRPADPSYHVETARLVAEAEKVVTRAESRLVAARDDVKDAKKALDTALDHLRHLIRDRKAGVQELPLFAGQPAPDSTPLSAALGPDVTLSVNGQPVETVGELAEAIGPAKRRKPRSTAPARSTPEALVRSIAESLAAFELEQEAEWCRTSLRGLGLPEDLTLALDAIGGRAGDVLRHVESGRRLADLSGVDDAAAQVVAEQLAASFAGWSAAQLQRSANALDAGVAAAVQEVEGGDADEPNEQPDPVGDVMSEGGVYNTFETLPAPLPKSSKCSAEVRIAHDREDGLWYTGVEYRSPDAGGGSNPSPKWSEAHPTRNEAVIAGVDDLIKWFQSNARQEYRSEASRARYESAVRALHKWWNDLTSLHPAEAPAQQSAAESPDPDAWRSIPIDRLGLAVELVADARLSAVETAGALDEWLRSGDSDDLHDETREAYIAALDQVCKPNLQCARCDFVRPGDVAACTRCGAKSGTATDLPVSDLDALQAQARRDFAEHSDLDVYGDGPREPSKPGTLRIGSRDVPIRGALVEEEDKPKRGKRKAKAETSAPPSTDDLYTVKNARGRLPLYLVRARSVKEATDFARTQHDPSVKLKVEPAPLDIDTKGYLVKTVATASAQGRAAV